MKQFISEKWLGKEIGPGITHSITPEKVNEFCLAIGEINPIYKEKDAAQSAGYTAIPVPLTFQTSFLFWGYPLLYRDMRDIGIDVDRMVHLKEQYQYHFPLYIGDTVTSAVIVADSKFGKIDMVSFACEYKNQNDIPCLSANFTIAIRKMEEATQ